MQLFHALVYDGLCVGVLHAERTAARGRRRRRTRRAAVARRPTTPRRPTGARRHGHGVLMKPHEPRPIDGRRTATEPTGDLAHAPPITPPAATHRHRDPDATPTRPPRPPTPRRDHARFRAPGGAPRAPDELPPHARPSDRRADAPVHSAAPVAAPRPCTLQHPCAGARPRRSARLSRVLSERLAERRGFASFKNSHALLLYSVSQTFCRVRGANTSGSDCTA